MIWAIVIPLALLVFYVIGVFNQLQTLKVRIRASIQEIGNQLKRQMNLIPNLIDSAKGYLKHEKTIFDKLTEARKTVAEAVTSGDVSKMAKSQETIQKVLGSLKVIVESNPQLQAAGVVTNLMDELRDTADKVMYSRRTLIDLSADYNQKIVTFPSNLVAKMLGFKQEAGLKTAEMGEALEVKPEETETPKVDLS